PASSASWHRYTVAPRGIVSAHSRLNVFAPAGSTRTAALSPTRPQMRAASVSPSARNQSSDSRLPTTSGRTNTDPFSARRCPLRLLYLIAVGTPFVLLPL